MVFAPVAITLKKHPKNKEGEMKDYLFKILKPRKIMKICITLTLLFIIGCAGEAVRVELPLNHPANPQAPESMFSPPQNPFQTELTVMEEESTSDSTMKHKMPQESGRQNMGHKMGPKK